MLARLTASQVFSQLGGVKIRLGYLCHCPVPNHGKGKGDRNPSLWINDGERNLIVKCFAGCERNEILAALPQQNGTPQLREREPVRLRKKERQTTTAEALALWKSARPIKGTLAERYLASRRLPLLPSSSRFLEHAPITNSKFKLTAPALITAIQSEDHKICAVQSTFLDPLTGSKANMLRPRLITGPASGGAARLGKAGKTIGIAEGLETAWAASLMYDITVWASLGAERMPLMKMPEIVETVIVYADPDHAGQRAAQKFEAANPQLKVIHRPPPSLLDYASLYEIFVAAALEGKEGVLPLSPSVR